MDMTQYAGKESSYLKAADLQGKTPNVVIEGVELVQFENDGKTDTKPALKLKGKEKKLVLNATNTDSVIRKYGADSEAWIGKTIMLSTQYYQAFDKEGLIVTPIVETDPDDEIPF